jgi:quinol monooxygenase YgiN
MIGGLKHVVVKEGLEKEFETLFIELRKQIGKYENGCLLYSLLKSRSKPRAYIVQEQYRDEGSLDEHQTSNHGKTYFPKMRAVLESIEVEYFDGVVS